jgi:hypothetical protein
MPQTCKETNMSAQQNTSFASGTNGASQASSSGDQASATPNGGSQSSTSFAPTEEQQPTQGSSAPGNSPGDGLIGLLGGSDTIVPDTQHLGSALGATFTQIETDGNGALGNVGELPIQPDTAIPNGASVVPDGDAVATQLLNGAPQDVLSDAPANALGDLGNGSIVDSSVLPGGVDGSSPLLDANVDPSQGSSVDAVSAGQGANGNAIDADTLPASLGDIADAGALASPTAGDGGASVTAGDGPSLLSADALTGTVPVAGGVTDSSLDGMLGGSQSSSLIDANAGQPSDGTVADANVLTSPQPSDGAIGAAAGNGPTQVNASELTGNDQLQVAGLNGSGTDSLVGALTSQPTASAMSAAPVATAPVVSDVADTAGNLDPSSIAAHVASTAQQVTHPLI